MSFLSSLSPEARDELRAFVDAAVQEALAAQEHDAASPWLSLDEAADYLRVSVRTLERLLAKAKVRSTTLGRRRLLHRDDLDALPKAATREDVAPTTPPRRRAATLDPALEEA